MKRVALLSLVLFLTWLLASLFFGTSQPTSKVTWDHQFGLPFQFIQVERYSGPCSPDQICRRLHIASFDSAAFLLDILLALILIRAASYLLSLSDDRIN